MNNLNLIIFFIFIFGSGCTFVQKFNGGILEREDFEALVAAKTKSDVLEYVGPPNDVELQLNGSLFIYRFQAEEGEALSLSLFQSSFDYTIFDRRTQRLTVFFDKAGNKTGYGFDSAQLVAKPNPPKSNN